MGGKTSTLDYWLAQQLARVKKNLRRRGEIHRGKLKRHADANHGAEVIVVVKGSHGGVSSKEMER